MPTYEEIEGAEPIGRGGFAEVRLCSRSDDGANRIWIRSGDFAERSRFCAY
jgi:hypothetical protein